MHRLATMATTFTTGPAHRRYNYTVSPPVMALVFAIGCVASLSIRYNTWDGSDTDQLQPLWSVLTTQQSPLCCANYFMLSSGRKVWKLLGWNRQSWYFCCNTHQLTYHTYRPSYFHWYFLYPNFSLKYPMTIVNFVSFMFVNLNK